MILFKHSSQLALFLLAAVTLSACKDNAVVLKYDNLQTLSTRDSYGNLRWSIRSPQFCEFGLTVNNNMDEVLESLKVSWWLDGVRENLRINNYGFKRKNIKIGETTKSQIVSVRVNCEDFKKAKLRVEQCMTSTKVCDGKVVEEGH